MKAYVFWKKIKAIGWISVSAAISQIAGVLALPILTRLYPVEAISVFGYLVLTSTFLSIFTTLKVESEIAAASSSEDRIKLGKTALRNCMMGSILVSICFFPLIFFKSEFNNSLLIAIFLPLFVIITSIGSVTLAFAVLSRAYSSIALAGLLRSFSGISLAVVFGLWFPDLKIFLFTQLISQAIPIVIFWKFIPRNSKIKPFKFFEYIVKYKQSALYGSLEYLGASFQGFLPVIFMQKVSDNIDLIGFYLGSRILTALNAILVESSRPLLINKFKEKIDSGNVKDLEKLFIRTTLLFTFVPICISSILAFVLPKTITLLLGSGYSGSVGVIQIVVVTWISVLCIVPSYIFNSLIGNFKALLKMRIISVGGQTAIFLYSYTNSFDSFKYLILNFFFTSIVSLYLILFTQKIVHNKS